MTSFLHLDFESRSTEELQGPQSIGLHNYWLHPETKPLMLAYAYGEEPPKLWQLHVESMPANLRKGLEDSKQSCAAWNSSFERYGMKYKLGIDIPIERWIDPQASARYLSLPGALDKVGDILNLPRELQKDERGEDLIKLFSLPHMTRKKKGETQTQYFNDWSTHPKEWEEFGEYCFVPSHKLLNEKLCWVEANNFNVGEAVLGFDEFGPNRRLRKAIIEKISYANEAVFDVLLESGKHFYVTAKHRWLVGRHRRTHASESQSLRWIETRHLVEKSKRRDASCSHIPRILDTWDSNRTYDEGWLAGIFDGEGTVQIRTDGTLSGISVSQNIGPILDHIKELLTKLDFQWAESSSSKRCKKIYLLGGRYSVIRLLGILQTARLNKKIDFDKLGRLECRGGSEKVLSVTYIGKQRIIRIQTSTGTLLVDGYPMHNCKQDVWAEREVMRRLTLLKVFPLPELERKIWVFDQKVNDRGMPVDLQFVKNMYALGSRSKQEAVQKQNEITGLENANSNPQMLAWVQTQGYSYNTLKKGTVDTVLKYERDVLTPFGIQVLEARKAASSTTYKKLAAILRQISPDGRLRGQFIYMGSARCGRWSGNAVQLQNMARPDGKFEDETVVNHARDLVYKMDYDGILQAYGSVLLTVKNLIRTVFVAPENKRLNVADLNAIETRVGAWMAQCQPLLDVFKPRPNKPNGNDPYLDFAMKMTGIQYDALERDIKSTDAAIKAAAKKHRQVAKPGVLGCFGEGTLVLTQRGWVPIIEVALSDSLFDGIEWVRHGGVLDKGMKDVIDFNGVKVTPDHQILAGEEWRCVWDVSQDSQLENQAINLANGLLSEAKVKINNIIMSVIVLCAANVNQLLNKIWRGAEQKLVSNAQAIFGKKRRKEFTYDLTNILKMLLTDSQTGITQLRPDADPEGTLDIPVGVYPVNLKTCMSLSRMSSNWKTSIKRNTSWTEKITTAITSKETLGLSLQLLITLIKRQIVALSIKGCLTQQQFSGNYLPLHIEMLAILPERSGWGFLQRELSPSNHNAEVRTYDILNCGSRNRFLVLTNKGPVIAHNCVYRLGGGSWGKNKYGDKIKTGYWGYAEAMGIEMTQEQAHQTVRVFRESYLEIVQAWYDLENAIAAVLAEGAIRVKREFGPNGCIKIDKLTITQDGNRRNILRIQLPSGRFLHYLDAQLQEVMMPWKDANGSDVYKETLTYSGLDQETKVWKMGITSHGGKVFENIDQGIARDVLAEKMLQLEEMGFEILGHAHDESICLSVNDPFTPGALEMISTMSKEVNWAPGLLLGADGWEGLYYKKG
jgi:DNA polymerase